MKFKVMFNFLL